MRNIKLTETEKSLANAMIKLMNHIKDKDKDISFQDLKNLVLDIFWDESLHISDQTRRKNIYILNKFKYVDDLISWCYNMCLKGDNLGVI